MIGAGEADAETSRLAKRVGGEIARRGATLVCGGRTGVMEAAARGAVEAGGLSVGILPTYDWRAGNPYLTVVLPTGLGQARNAIVAAASDAVIALAGEYGTLSEIGLALKLGRAVIGLRAWRHIEGVTEVDDPVSAVDAAMAAAIGQIEKSR